MRLTEREARYSDNGGRDHASCYQAGVVFRFSSEVVSDLIRLSTYFT